MTYGLYIHIPYCKEKCKYCDFTSYSGRQDSMSEYFTCIINELQSYKNRVDKDNSISTIFIGGGTPTFVNSEYIVSILKYVYDNFNVLSNAEISIEGNPGTVSLDALVDYRGIGINRISFGLQTSDSKQLKVLGRIHDYDDYVEAIRLAKLAGFKNINTDLIIGIPGQDWASQKDTLEKVISMDIKHISCYSLIIEEGTPFFKMYNSGKLILPDETEERKIYHNTISFLKKNGFEQYEISNFSKNGYQCRHNVDCWKCKEYIGVGVGASSYFNGSRYSNVQNIDGYIKAINSKYSAVYGLESISKVESMKEYMMLGLRLISGVNEREFFEKYNMNLFDVFQKEIEKLINNGLVEYMDNSVRLTKQGLDLANLAFMEFV